MTFFKLPKFLRRFLRRTMTPMVEERAWTMKNKLSLLYAFIAWNTFAVVVYQIYQGNKHWPRTAGLRTKEEDELRPAAYYANLLGVKKAQVYTVSGFHISKSQVGTEIQPADQSSEKEI